MEVGGPKNILLKSANVQKMSKAQLPVEMPVLPGKGNYDLSLDLRDWDGIPIGGAQYTIAFESGAVIKGTHCIPMSSPNQQRWNTNFQSRNRTNLGIPIRPCLPQ